MGLFQKRPAGPATATPAPSPEQAALQSVGWNAGVEALPDSLTAHSQFVKRASCVACGAPKTLPSKTAYLYCDYCGALVDYDFRLANAGTNAGITNTVYHRLAAPYQAAMAQARAARDFDGYREIMRYIYYYWMEECPQALSPRARTDLEFRQRMVTYLVESTVCKDMDPELEQLEARINTLIAAFQRVPTPGGAWMVAGDFWTVAALWKQLMELAYERARVAGVSALDPDEPPPGVALKMEFSTFCQAWLPHLSAADGDRLLAMYGLTGDYDQVQPKPTEARRCGGCGVELHALVGARVVVCEDCGHRVDVGAGAVPCHQCGAPLSYPVGVSRLKCPYCRADTHRV